MWKSWCVHFIFLLVVWEFMILLWSFWNICSWFLYRMRDKNCFILLHLDIQFQRCSLFFFPNVCFWPLWKNQVAVVVCFCIWVIYSIPLMKVSVIMPVPCCFYYYGPILQLKVKCGDTCLSFVFCLLMCLVLIKVSLTVRIFYASIYVLRIIFIPIKNSTEIFIEIT